MARCIHVSVLSITPPDALALLTSATRFDDAFGLGVHFGLDLSVEAIAEKCVWLASQALPTWLWTLVAMVAAAQAMAVRL